MDLLAMLFGSCSDSILLLQCPNQSSEKCPIFGIRTFSASKNIYLLKYLGLRKTKPIKIMWDLNFYPESGVPITPTYI